MSECRIVEASSRVCERGTKCCVVTHGSELSASAGSAASFEMAVGEFLEWLTVSEIAEDEIGNIQARDAFARASSILGCLLIEHRVYSQNESNVRSATMLRANDFMNTKTGNAENRSLHSLDMRRVILDYEVSASWWAEWVGIAWLQDLTASYFAWKVNRKYARWVAAKAMSRRVKAHIAESSDSRSQVT